MACPYFFPVQRFSEGAWNKHPRLPLGDPFTGICRADPTREFGPDDQTLRAFCNIGYARERCPRFPAGKGPDAYRFSVVRDEAGTLSIFYVAEQDRKPMEHGSIDYSLSTRRFLTDESRELLIRQAQAYVESYLRRKSEPEDDAKHPHRR